MSAPVATGTCPVCSRRLRFPLPKGERMVIRCPGGHDLEVTRSGTQIVLERHGQVDEPQR
jgi:hypothetical protein